VAKSGDMKVGTPVATMGIRGTAVNVTISADNGATNVSVMAEADNLLHTVLVLPETQMEPGPAARYGHQQYRRLRFQSDADRRARSRTRKDAATIQKEQALVAQVFQLQSIWSAISAGAGQ